MEKQIEIYISLTNNYLVGLTWTNAQREVFETEENLTLDDMRIDFEFTFDYEGKDCFPMFIKEGTSFAYFGIASQPTTAFQTFNISMKIEYIPFNWYAGAHSKSVFLILILNFSK